MDLSIDYEQWESTPEVEEPAFDSVSLEIEGYDAEWVDIPEPDEAPPPVDAEPEAVASEETQAASFRNISRRGRRRRESQIRPARPKSTKVDGLQRVVAWCVVSLAAVAAAAMIVRKPWAVAAVLLMSSSVLAALHGSKSLSDGRPQKKKVVLQSSMLRMVAAWLLATLLSQVLPPSYVMAGPLPVALLLSLALGVFCYAWLAPALRSFKVSMPVVVVLVACVFAGVHFAAMLRGGAAISQMQGGMSLVMGVAYSAAYAARPKPIEITAALALQMFVCQL